MIYHNFDLHAGNVATSGDQITFQVRVQQSPQGEMERAIESSMDRVSLSKQSGSPMDLGRLLFEALFPVNSEVRSRLNDSIAAISAQPAKEGAEPSALRIRLHLPPQLQVFPWELMLYNRVKGEDTTSDFLALNNALSIVRYEDMGIAKPDIKVSLPAHCVFAATSPESDRLSPLAIDKANVAFQEACGKNKNIRIKPIVRATIRTLEHALTAGPTPVFVFYGHGFFPNLAESTEPARIYLQDENGDEDILCADDLAVLLRNAGVRLAIFISCSSARRSTDRHWSGIAPALAKSGVGAVVAMQGEISEQSGLILCEKLAAALSTGIPIDEAMCAARMGISLAKSDDWHKPVLYMRDDSGVLLSQPAVDKDREEARATVRAEFKNMYGDFTGMKAKAILSGKMDITGIFGTIGAGGRAIGLSVDDLVGGNASVNMTADIIEQGATVVGLEVGSFGAKPEKDGTRSFSLGAARHAPEPIPDAVDVAIVTPISKEYIEIQKIITAAQIVPDAVPSAVYGRIGKHSAICLQLGKGIADAAAGMQACLDRWHPRRVILAGIGGSLDAQKASYGDIVVASFIYGLDYGQIVAGKYVRRPDYDVKPDAHLLDEAQNFVHAARKDWSSLVKYTRPDSKPASATKVSFEYFLSGNQVVDDPDYVMIAQAMASAPGAVVIEMEAMGAGAAIHRAQAHRVVQFLAVRGISDVVEHTAQSTDPDAGKNTRTQWKSYVTSAVGAFVKGLLLYIPPVQHGNAAGKSVRSASGIGISSSMNVDRNEGTMTGISIGSI